MALTAKNGKGWAFALVAALGLSTFSAAKGRPTGARFEPLATLSTSRVIVCVFRFPVRQQRLTPGVRVADPAGLVTSARGPGPEATPGFFSTSLTSLPLGERGGKKRHSDDRVW